MSHHLYVKGAELRKYMDGRIEKMTPPNWFWKARKKVPNYFGWIALIIWEIIFLRNIAPAYFHEENMYADVRAMGFALGSLCVLGLAWLGIRSIARFFSRPPGKWRWYSIAEFHKVYGLPLPGFDSQDDHLLRTLDIRELMNEIRRSKPEAEFVFFVLEHPYQGYVYGEDEEFHGAVFAQVMEDLFTPLAVEKPLVIFDGDAKLISWPETV